ncbi:NAD-specific glutamate dehydrogenase [compost metagenome]
MLDRRRHVQQLPLGAGIELATQTGLFLDPVCQQMIEIIATQRRVAAGSHHLEHPAMQTQDGNVKGAATEVIDGDHPFLTGVEAVGDGGGGGLVEQAQHVQTGQPGRILGALALGVIKIGGHCDDHTVEITAEGGGAALGQFFEDLRRDLHRIDQPLAGLDLGHAVVGGHELVRLLTGIHVGQRLAHHPFDRDDGVVGIEGGFALGVKAHPDGVGLTSLIVHHGGQQIAPLFVTQGIGLAAAYGGNQGVGGAEIDAYGTFVLMRRGALAGLGDLQ